MSWLTVPLRKLISPTSIRNRADLPLLSVVREKGVIMRKLDKSDNHNAIPDDLTNYKVVSSGKFVINKMKAWQGSCGVSMFDGIVSPAYFVFDLQIDNPKFFNYAIRSHYYVHEFGRISKGIRVGQWDLDLQQLKYLKFLLPPQEEQNQIVRYLDWKVSQVNKLINAKKKQIALLQEQKQAAINAAVTQGGEGWKETRLGNLGRFRKGYGGSRADDAEGGVSCIRYGDIYRSGEYVLKSPMTRIAVAVVDAYARINKGEVLFPLSGETKEDIGMAIVNEIDEDTWCSGDCAVFSTNGTILPKFLTYALRCPYLVQQRASIAKGDIIVHLSTSAIRQLRVLVPPLELQQRIIIELDAVQSKTTRIVSFIKKEITLLHEYRTRLISDVVTGKLDIRNVSIPDYEAVEEATDITNEETEETEDELDAD